jgi:heat shock protein HspQ
MSEQRPSTARPFVFTVIEDDGVNVTIEVSEKDYQADLAAGIDEEATMKPGRYKMKRGGFLARHPELQPDEKKSA